MFAPTDVTPKAHDICMQRRVPAPGSAAPASSGPPEEATVAPCFQRPRPERFENMWRRHRRCGPALAGYISTMVHAGAVDVPQAAAPEEGARPLRLSLSPTRRTATGHPGPSRASERRETRQQSPAMRTADDPYERCEAFWWDKGQSTPGRWQGRSSSAEARTFISCMA